MKTTNKNFQNNLKAIAESRAKATAQQDNNTDGDKNPDVDPNEQQPGGSGSGEGDKNPTPDPNIKNQQGEGGNVKGEPVINDDLFFKYASEKLQKEVKSFDDLVVKEEVPKYNSEFAEKYDKFYQETQRSVEDFLFVQKDVDAMKQEDLIRVILSEENPELDAEDIEVLYNEEYSFDEEYDDESIIKRKKIAGKQAASKAKKLLKERQEKFKLKDDNKNPNGALDFKQQIEAHNERVRKEFEETSANWKKAVGENVKDFDGIEVKISDDLKFKYQPTEEQKIEAYNTVADVTFQELVKPYTNKDGAIDTKALHQDIFKMRNFDAILETSIKQAIAYGRELEVKERVNPRGKRTGAMDAKLPENLSNADKFRIQMLKKAGRY